MYKESDIYKYCLIKKAIILLYMILSNVIYPLIHVLMILRTAVICIIYKKLYNSNSENSDSEMIITVLISKNS